MWPGILIFLKKRRDLDYKRFSESSANQSNLVQLITGMQEIKLTMQKKESAGSGSASRQNFSK